MTFDALFLPLYSYKVVMSLSDPVGDSVQLTDLRPYTVYQLSVRAKDEFTQGNTVVVANMNFSTAGRVHI